MLNFIEQMGVNRKYLLLILTAFVVYACVKKKTYSQSPEIEYKRFTPFQGDSAEMVIGFSDGDGDIGSDNDRNLFINYYYRDSVTGKYVGYYDFTKNDTTRFSYTIKKPSDNYNGKPISGEVSVILEQYRHSKKAKNIKYTIYMLDQAGHKSNVITTPEITVP